jgi:hypothetical protein
MEGNAFNRLRVQRFKGSEVQGFKGYTPKKIMQNATNSEPVNPDHGD